MVSGEAKAKARARATAIFGFYKHLAAYVIVNLMLFFINLVTTPDYFWCVWPLIGWGVAVAVHAVRVYAFGGEGEIVDRLTEKELHGKRRGHT